MNNIYKDLYYISDDVLSFVDSVEESLKEKFDKLEEIREYNEIKVIKAMQDERLSQVDFKSSSGYG